MIGSPGKVVRELTDPEVALLQMSAMHYIKNAQRYRQQLELIA